MLNVYYLKISDYKGCNLKDLSSLASKSAVENIQFISSDKVKRSKLLGDIMRRQLLLKLCHLSEKDYRVLQNDFGKPFLSGLKTPVYFNISHSNEYIVIAISDCEVGVDIEFRSEAKIGIAHRFFHVEEYRKLQQSHGEVQRIMFFDYWSAKESYLKYCGTGLSGSLSSFWVDFSNDVSYIVKGHSRVPVFLRECPIDVQYSSFICSETDEEPILESYELDS